MRTQVKRKKSIVHPIFPDFGMQPHEGKQQGDEDGDNEGDDQSAIGHGLIAKRSFKKYLLHNGVSKKYIYPGQDNPNPPLPEVLRFMKQNFCMHR